MTTKILTASSATPDSDAKKREREKPQATRLSVRTALRVGFPMSGACNRECIANCEAAGINPGYCVINLCDEY